MGLLEQFLMAKTGHDETCGDALYIGDHYLAVIDGATSKQATPGLELPRIAALTVAAALQALAPETGLHDALHQITRALQDTAARLDLPGDLPEALALVASAAIVSLHRREVWRVGDCQIIVNGTSYPRRTLVDEVTSGTRALRLAELIRTGAATEASLLERDLGREFIQPLLSQQTCFLNQERLATPFAYVALCGIPVPAWGIERYYLPAGPVDLVLASDGYPELHSTLEASEAALTRILTRDPLCYQEFKSTKGCYPGQASFDDRAYLRLRLD